MKKNKDNDNKNELQYLSRNKYMELLKPIKIENQEVIKKQKEKIKIENKSVFEKIKKDINIEIEKNKNILLLFFNSEKNSEIIKYNRKEKIEESLLLQRIWMDTFMEQHKNIELLDPDEDY